MEETAKRPHVLAKKHTQIISRYPRYGYRLETAPLRQEDQLVDVKRVYRLWKRAGLEVP